MNRSRGSWAPSPVAVALLLTLGGTMVALAVSIFAWRSAVHLLDAEKQRSRGGIAERIAELEKAELLGLDGTLDAARAQDVIARLEALSPDDDFYLLDLRGRIVAPTRDRGLAMTSISMRPLRRFMDRRRFGEESELIRGPDPLDAAAARPFSAALLPARGEPAGYLYVVLGNPLRQDPAPALRQQAATRLAGGAATAILLLAAAAATLLHFRVRRPALQLKQRIDSALGHAEPVGLDHPAPATIEDGLERLLALLEKREKSLRRLQEVRQEALTHFTHDLRTPIATLRGYLETLALGSELSPSKRQGYLDIALRHSERLSRLVDELLELSRLQQVDVPPRLERFRLGELVQDNIQRFRCRAEEKAIELDSDFDPDLPPVFANVALMERALENLIENALRHASAGDRVSVRLRHHGHRLQVSVIDSGAGIAAEDLPHIFERFYRGSGPDRTDDHRGSGLGLAITHRIVELHGSELQVESRLGAGSTFTFSLDIAPLTYQLSSGEQKRLKPLRWPPRFSRGHSAELRGESAPAG